MGLTHLRRASSLVRCLLAAVMCLSVVGAVQAQNSDLVKDTGIEIFSPFPGVKVSVDGIYKGVTAYVVEVDKNRLRIKDLSLGTHSLSFDYPNYTFPPESVTVSPNAYTSYSVLLIGKNPVAVALSSSTAVGLINSGTLQLRSNPVAVSVKLDGELLGLTDMSVNSVSVGMHQISFENKGRVLPPVDFEVLKGQKITIMADFMVTNVNPVQVVADPGYPVSITTKPENGTPDDAAVVVDGNAVNRSLVPSLLLGYGRHEVTATKLGYVSATKSFEINKTDTIEVLLEVEGTPAFPNPLPLPQPVWQKWIIDPSEGPIVPEQYIKHILPLQVGAENWRIFNEAERARGFAVDNEVTALLNDSRARDVKFLSVTDHLKWIQTIDAVATRLETEYENTRKAGIAQATTLFDIEIAALKRTTSMNPWESEADYKARVNLLTGPLESIKRKDLDRYAAFLLREAYTQNARLRNASEKASSSLMSSLYSEEDASIRFSVGEYSLSARRWPISVQSSSLRFPYSASFFYSIVADKDQTPEAAYKLFSAAIVNGSLKARLVYSYTKVPGDKLYNVVIIRAELYDTRTGKVYASGGEPKTSFFNGIEGMIQASRLRLESPISSTQVSVDGRDLGTCPVETVLGSGIKKVRFSWEGGPVSSEEREVSIELGSDLTLRATENLAQVEIQGLPVGATVTVDGANVKWLPGPLILMPGKHSIEATNSGYNPLSADLSLSKGDIVPLTMNLVRLSRLRLESVIPSTRVFVDGKDLGTCPVETMLGSGTKKVRFSWEGGPVSSEEREVSIELGSDLTLRATENLAQVEIHGLPVGATVTVDGANVKWLPGPLILMPGKHSIEATNSGYNPLSADLSLSKGDIVPLTMNLVPSLVQMLPVEGGSFMMGSVSGEADEKPVKQMRLSSFLMSRTEITQEQWRIVMGSTPSFARGDLLPVEQISWHNAVEFCNRLSVQQGLIPVYTINGIDVKADFSRSGYRLPTEAEWEYAARGGNQSRKYNYSGSNEIATVSWYVGNSGNKSMAVATKVANELGLFDMSGNVWEWCQDWYDAGYYASSSPTDPTGPASGTMRVLRGSWFDDQAQYHLSTNRGRSYPSTSNKGIGFRVVRRAS